MDDLWGEDVPETATKMVQIAVSQLRKVLQEGTIRTSPPGYVVVVGTERLDLERFERLRSAGQALLEAGEASAAAERLREALALWRGPALEEFTEPFARIEAARLEELRLSCLEARIDAELGVGPPRRPRRRARGPRRAAPAPRTTPAPAAARPLPGGPPARRPRSVRRLSARARRDARDRAVGGGEGARTPDPQPGPHARPCCASCPAAHRHAPARGAVRLERRRLDRLPGDRRRTSST